MSYLLTHINQINNLMRSNNMVWPGRTMQEVVTEFGRAFTPALRPEGLNKMPDRECFCNATKLVQYDPSLVYVEGFALPDGIPIAIHHAWVMDQNGDMIDPTWSTAGTEYFGVPFLHEYHLKAMAASEMYSILDNWRWREIYSDDPELFLYKE